mgnify:CR=1 FL=1
MPKTASCGLSLSPRLLAEVKKHLEDLGFTAGGSITVVSALGGNIIVKVKESRVAISEEMARKIMI